MGMVTVDYYYYVNAALNHLKNVKVQAVLGPQTSIQAKFVAELHPGKNHLFTSHSPLAGTSLAPYLKTLIHASDARDPLPQHDSPHCLCRACFRFPHSPPLIQGTRRKNRMHGSQPTA